MHIYFKGIVNIDYDINMTHYNFRCCLICVLYTTIVRVSANAHRLLIKLWCKLFVTWSNSISHLGRPLLHRSLRVIKLQPRFNVYNISYLRVIFHTYLLLTLCYINHKDIKGKEGIHATIYIILTLISKWLINVYR